MAYFAPYVDAAGLHIPTYTDIRDELVSEAKAIFGQDIYLENDSMDYQYISAVALKMSDTMQAAQLAYNNRSPDSAIGSGLDGLIKLNGLKRKTPSYSSCVVVVAGDAGTVITAGVVQDVSGNLWSLPSTVTIGSGGTVSVSAVCQKIGAITAQAGDISKITTPTKGWISVTNEVAAVPGQPVELDSQVRSRQAISTELPSQTLLEGSTGAIASVSGVTRYKVYENDTDTTDSDGLPPHSITAVVEGGPDEDIAQALSAHKGIGGGTNGTTAVTIVNAYGVPGIYKFYRPDYVLVDVAITVKALAGYTSATTEQIKQNLFDYLNGLQIGDNVAVSSLWGVALSAMPSLKNPLFSITALTAAKDGDPLGTADIVIAFNEVSQGNLDNIAVTVV